MTTNTGPGHGKDRDGVSTAVKARSARGKYGDGVLDSRWDWIWPQEDDDGILDSFLHRAAGRPSSTWSPPDPAVWSTGKDAISSRSDRTARRSGRRVEVR